MEISPWKAPEKMSITLNGYGAITASSVQELSVCLNALGNYLITDVLDDGKTLVYTATGYKTKIAKWVDVSYGEGGPQFVWTCQDRRLP